MREKNHTMECLANHPPCECGATPQHVFVSMPRRSGKDFAVKSATDRLATAAALATEGEPEDPERWDGLS